MMPTAFFLTWYLIYLSFTAALNFPEIIEFSTYKPNLDPCLSTQYPLIEIKVGLYLNFGPLNKLK